MSLFCQRSLLSGGEVILSGSRSLILLKEGRFNEEKIGMIGEFKYRAAIFRAVDCVGDINNLKSRADLYRPFQRFQGKPRFPGIAWRIPGADPHRRIVSVSV